jgi:ferredoxin
MSIRVEVDQRSCQSSGRCVAAAPGGFALDADHLARALAGVSQLDRRTLCEIARNCPALAIRLFEASGEEIDF